MCHCNPNIRTPFCGRPGCEWPEPHASVLGWTGPRALFQWGSFVLSSGQRSPLRIECDALGAADWLAIAEWAAAVLPPFQTVEGVPRGGLRLAALLSPRARATGGLLIVDDVLTTGRSMERQRAGREAQGIVLFARGVPPPWVKALLRLEVEPYLEPSAHNAEESNDETLPFGP